MRASIFTNIQEQVDRTEFLFGLFKYLRDNNIAIDTNVMNDFFLVMQEDDIPPCEASFMEEAICTLAAKSKEEEQSIRDLFSRYLKHREEIKKQKEKEKQHVESLKKESQNRKKRLENEIASLDKELENAKHALEKQNERILKQESGNDDIFKTLKKKYDKEVAPCKKEIDKLLEKAVLKQKDHPFTRLEDVLDQKVPVYNSNDLSEINSYFPIILKMAVKEKNAMKLMNAISASMDIIKKLEKITDKKAEMEKDYLQERVRNLTNRKASRSKEYESESDNLKKRVEQYLQKQQEKQNMISSANTQIVKQGSLYHREDFIGGKNGVLSFSEEEIKVLEKNFSSLSDRDKELVNDTIRQNIRKFRTKVSRSIYTSSKKKLDLPGTIKKSCAYGGVPINLVYEKPVKQKTKLALFLDVSGSCKKASELMITFAYHLQSIFPGGCLVYAFIGKVYDISYIMQQNDINTVCKAVLETIPRSGAYSNYYQAFSIIDDLYYHKLTKDTICFFIGDARNNKNPSGEEYIKKISRKCKTSYWLNTDGYEKWDQGDSIISTYIPYMKKAIPVKSAYQLIDFLTTML